VLTQNNKRILGVVGGLGPLASAEFLKTIYEHSLAEREQDSPIVIVYSDPTFPDRTEQFLQGSYGLLLELLVEALQRLSHLHASRIVICCMTIHHLLHEVPAELRAPVISLVDVIFDKVMQTRQRHLLVCTNGTRQLEIFQRHEQWESVRDYIVLPVENDQQMIHHDILYQVKKNRDMGELTARLEGLVAKYEVGSFIAGCTETHLLAKQFAKSNGNGKRYGCVDPLTIIAQQIAQEWI
jgi:aspartate racemase